MWGHSDADEAGYLVVARTLHQGGPNLYGHYFVDRPPGLLLLYRLAALTDWAPSIRVLATVLALLLVVAAAWAAHEVVGARGARWAAMVAASSVVTPVMMAQEADGEILAAPLVMLALALTLAAVRRTGWPAFGLATGAGLAAGAAVMVKQNFGDGVVFAARAPGRLAGAAPARSHRRDGRRGRGSPGWIEWWSRGRSRSWPWTRVGLLHGVAGGCSASVARRSTSSRTTGPPRPRCCTRPRSSGD